MRAHAVWMAATLPAAVGACGGTVATDADDDVVVLPDAPPSRPDAADDVATGLAALGDDEWAALCEAIYADAPLALDGQGNLACLDADCEASPTAAEDCAAATAPAAASCAPPDPLDPLRDCAAPVEAGRQCLAAMLGQFEPYATLTCAGLAALAPVSFELAMFAACQPLLEDCPDLVVSAR